MKLTEKIGVLDNGYVELVRIGGYDDLISRVAGISYGDRGNPTVETLINQEHLGPFEFADITYRIKCPIAMARQIMRSRTFSYVEKSLRYCEVENDFYTPSYETERERIFNDAYDAQYETYQKLRALHVKKEKARLVIGVGAYTELYLKADLRNLMHFFDLRLDKTAQKETQEVAKAMSIIFSENFPKTAKAYFNKDK